MSVPGDVTVNTVERCSGHDGTWGVKKPSTRCAMKIGRPVFKAMARDEPDVISSDCPLAGRHIEQGMQQAGTPAKALQHPLTPDAHGLRLWSEHDGESITATP